MRRPYPAAAGIDDRFQHREDIRPGHARHVRVPVLKAGQRLYGQCQIAEPATLVWHEAQHPFDGLALRLQLIGNVRSRGVREELPFNDQRVVAHAQEQVGHDLTLPFRGSLLEFVGARGNVANRVRFGNDFDVIGAELLTTAESQFLEQSAAARKVVGHQQVRQQQRTEVALAARGAGKSDCHVGITPLADQLASARCCK